MRWIVVGVAVLAAACTTDKWGNGDAGVYYQDGGSPGDKDLSGSFVWVIPEGAWLCSGFHEGRTWEQELAMLSMIELAPGTYVLEREEKKVATEGFIKRVLFSPERIEALPRSGMGRFEAVHYPGVEREGWSYTFTMPMRMEGKEAEVELYVGLDHETGEWPAEISLDLCYPDMMMGARLNIAPAEDTRFEVQAFGRCGYSYPPERLVTATGANGDVIKLTVEHGASWESCFNSGHTRCYFLTGAEVDIGGYTETVTDPWRLVYNGSHHNWTDKYLILLEPPAGDVHAVLVIGEYNEHHLDPVMPEFVYLDADLQELRRESEVAWECVETPLW